MAIFYTDTGSIGKLQVSGSGTSIFSISGSSGPLFDVSDISIATTNIFTITSASIDVFNIDRNQIIDISGSLNIQSTTAGTALELYGASAANILYASSSGRIGIGTNNPSGRFDISYPGILNDPTILVGADDTGGTTRTNNTTKLARLAVAHYNNSATSSTILAASSTGTANILFIGGGSAYMNSANSIQFYTGATTASLTGVEIMRLSGSREMIVSASVFITGSLTVSQSITTLHLIGNSAVPTVAVGTGAGTGAAGSVVGTDIAGALRLRTGTAPAALARIGTVSFSAPYASPPYVIFSPANTGSAALSSSFGIHVTSSTTGFSAFSGISALPVNLQLSWSYHVIQ